MRVVTKAKLVVVAIGLVAVQLAGSAQSGAQNLATAGVDPNQYRYTDFETFNMKGRTGDFLSGDVTVTGGNLPWDSILVTVTCDGKASFTTTTDPKGGFIIARKESFDSKTVIGKEKPFLAQFVGCTVIAALPGFQSSRITIPNRDIKSGSSIGSIKLTPEGGSTGSAVSPTTGSAPKEAMKYFQKARNEWLNNKPDRAQVQLQKAVEIYPQFAEAWYVLGRIQAASNSRDAFHAFTKAVEADPNFVLAYEQMASLSAQAAKWQDLVHETNRALELNPRGNLDVWYYHALGNYQLKNWDAAETSALKSLSMDPLHVQTATEQLLAVILIAKQDLPGALQHLHNCLTYFPPGPNLDLVKRQIAQVESTVAEKAAPPKEAPSAEVSDVSEVPNISTVRDSSLATNPKGSCRIDEVLPKVTLHVEEFVENVNRFTATEILVRERLDGNGNIKDKAQSKSNYIATIEKMPTGFYVVGEYRDESQRKTNHEGTIRANVAPALVLIFHSSHIEEFEMACEGQAKWSGHNTWRVDFWQRMDRPATMSGFEVGNKEYTVLLKGSAWIDRNNYQIVHMETDLLRSIPEMKLGMLHQSVDYGSVAFGSGASTLWLPQTAEVTADFRGKRLLERHIYSEFQIFSVNTEEKIKQPANSSN